MADDMTSANGKFDPMTSWARLSERVENQGKDIHDLRSNMNTGFQTVNANLSSLANEFRATSKTQWPVIWSAAGVCSALLVAAGTFFYGTLTKQMDRTESNIAVLSDRMVTRQEMDWRQARSQEDRTRTETAITDLRAASVTRNEWQERNRARDGEVQDLGRRVDEIRQEVGSVYGTRDALIDLKKEIDNLRSRLNTMP